MDDTYRSQFRLPYPLYEQLKAEADKNHRSVNAELVERLARTFDEDSRATGAGMAAPVDIDQLVLLVAERLRSNPALLPTIGRGYRGDAETPAPTVPPEGAPSSTATPVAKPAVKRIIRKPKA